MKNFIKRITAVVSFLAIVTAPLAYASTVNTTKITNVLISETYGNFAFLTITAKPGNAPACQTNPAYNYALDLSTSMGKSLLALIMVAKANGNDVYLSGSDTCPTFGIEKLLQAEIK